MNLHRTNPQRVICFGIVGVALMIATCAWAGDQAAIVNDLTSKGVKFTETQNEVTGVEAADISKLGDPDFLAIAGLTHLQKLSFGRGLTDHHLSMLLALTNVTTFTTNGSDLDDEGVAQLAHFAKLQTLTFFHPGKSFHGPGLLPLAALQNLESLTVAGSSAFGNEGVAAIAKLPHLKSLRIWHTNADVNGLAELKNLSGLTSVTIGQRLSFQPPVALSDETIGILVSLRSLESISLNEARLSLAALTQLKQLPSLKRLTLDSIDIPEGDIETLKRDLPKVQIKWTAPSPQSIKRIQALFPPAAKAS